MRIHGYCTVCRRIRLVTVAGTRSLIALAHGGVAEGVCAECEEKERERRRLR